MERSILGLIESKDISRGFLGFSEVFRLLWVWKALSGGDHVDRSRMSMIRESMRRM